MAGGESDPTNLANGMKPLLAAHFLGVSVAWGLASVAAYPIGCVSAMFQ